MMASERRKKRLEEKIQDLTIDLKREIKAREGIAHLFGVYESSPSYTNEEGQMNVVDQLAAADEVVNSFEGNLYKLQCALAQVNRQETPNSRLSKYIQSTKDKQGLACSILKIPLGQITTTQYDTTDSRGYDDDEFDDDPVPSGGVGYCTVNYDYQGQESDELTIKPGDVIKLLEKQDADWWLGELNGRTGIFPATYVEEMSS